MRFMKRMLYFIIDEWHVVSMFDKRGDGDTAVGCVAEASIVHKVYTSCESGA